MAQHNRSMARDFDKNLCLVVCALELLSRLLVLFIDSNGLPRSCWLWGIFGPTVLGTKPNPSSFFVSWPRYPLLTGARKPGN